MNKIKIAFVKFGGLAAGGTEKALQTIAANLPKDRYDVTYFYCDSAPYLGSDFVHPDTDPARKAYMEQSGVRLVKFDVGHKDIRTPEHRWTETNFWEKFNEADFDILQTARAGHAEYPFTEINEISQVDLITLPGMAENKGNVYATVHISNFQAQTWMKAGGNPAKLEIIPLFDELPHRSETSFRSQLGLTEKFVYGMHQRADNGIFSPVPLMCYKELESDDTAFVLMGGGTQYREQAVNLGLKNFYAIDHSGDLEKLHNFLATLDVFTHGRKDGETFGLAIAEAMYYGLPIVSHVAPAMGHVETIGEAGVVVDSTEKYLAEMVQLKNDKNYYEQRSQAAEKRFVNDLSLASNMKRWTTIYEACMKEKEEDDLGPEEFWEQMWDE